jgi:hypothetical protein
LAEAAKETDAVRLKLSKAEVGNDKKKSWGSDWSAGLQSNHLEVDVEN